MVGTRASFGFLYGFFVFRVSLGMVGMVGMVGGN